MSSSGNKKEPFSRPWSAAVSLSGALGPLLALAAVIAIFAAADQWLGSGSFSTIRNLRTVAVQASTVAVAALGMTVVIIAGGIDLSAGTALALCATVLAWCLKERFPPLVAVSAALGTGALAGLTNGILTSVLRVVPFIITLGTMTIYLGLAKLIAAETTVRPALDQVPAWLPALVQPNPQALAVHRWLGWEPLFASGVWGALALAAALAVVLRYTVFGRHVFALGSNEATARLCGINVPLAKVAVYTLSGLFIGMAGVYQFARLTSGNPTSGSGMELRIIAAVVIGGGSLSGGRGSVLGTLAGATMMAVIQSGCSHLLVSNPIQDILIGVIIVSAVTIDQLRQRRLS